MPTDKSNDDIPDDLERPAWLPDWEHLPGETLAISEPEPTNATEDTSWQTTTTLQRGIATNFMGGGVVPVAITDEGVANAAGGATGLMIGGIGGTQGGHSGIGGINMITVMLVVYSIASGLGLSLMWWKGIIDWKGNITSRFSSADTNIDDQPIYITVTDDNNNHWRIPLTWVERAAEHVSPGSEAVVEVNGRDGNTGRLPFERCLVAASQATGRAEDEN